MNPIHAILDGARISHTLPILKIVETGTHDTKKIAIWCSQNSASSFVTVDLDSATQESYHRELEELSAASSYTFRTQDHKKFLSELSWIDVAFLYPDNLQEGLSEYQLAVSAGARVVVMYDFQSRSSIAIKQAKRLGWSVHFTGEYAIMIRESV